MDVFSLIRAVTAPDKLAVDEVLRCNRFTARYGLVLSENDAKELVQWHTQSLQGHGRVEFGHGTITKIIRAFADSPFILQSNYADILSDLIEGFYYAKNETFDQIGDDDLVAWMRSRFNGPCQGSIDLLFGRELDALIRSIRFGHEKPSQERFDDHGMGGNSSYATAE